MRGVFFVGSGAEAEHVHSDKPTASRVRYEL